MTQMTQTMSLSAAADCYIRMEQEYRSAISSVLRARSSARAQLNAARRDISGTKQSALRQKRLEQEIELLTDEYYGLCDALHSICIYARRQEQEGA